MSKAIYRLQSILTSIEDIEYIFNANDIKMTKAIEDKILKPAMRMHIVKIAEQFSKFTCKHNRFHSALGYKKSMHVYLEGVIVTTIKGDELIKKHTYKSSKKITYVT